ncbi:hypothetical protein GCM10023149_18520 [Mucilaginibacter gynuensis]|uniref:Uncharacterized protein n=1 Tax=Mucilaginibacter gynuensis TaxID=1302236 RepID=A0ABP8G8U3_9SPHI
MRGTLTTDRFGESIGVPLKSKNILAEIGLLYGKRLIKDGHAISFSAGVSYNHAQLGSLQADDLYNTQYSNYPGLPFEFNISWFKSHKKKYKIYWLIPVGRPTGFGGSLGFKLSGNVSKYSYVALGMVIGMGYHKHY